MERNTSTPQQELGRMFYQVREHRKLKPTTVYVSTREAADDLISMDGIVEMWLSGQLIITAGDPSIRDYIMHKLSDNEKTTTENAIPVCSRCSSR